MDDVDDPEAVLMRRFFSTRHGFFAFAAVVCWSTLVVIDPKFRWVSIGVGCLYAVLSALFWAEALTRSNRPRRPELRADE